MMTLEASCGQRLQKARRCASKGGGQYTNTRTAAQGKHSQTSQMEPTRATGKPRSTSALVQPFDECFEQQLGKPELVVANHAILMQQITGDAGEPEFLQFFERRIHWFGAL